MKEKDYLSVLDLGYSRVEMVQRNSLKGGHLGRRMDAVEHPRSILYAGERSQRYIGHQPPTYAKAVHLLEGELPGAEISMVVNTVLPKP